jgi:hypothetical protein
MSTNSAERESNPMSTQAVDTRSPFVRLTELIGDTKPGKPMINLSVGEPQHPVRSSQRFRPLPGQQGYRTVSQNGCDMARPTIRATPSGRCRS